jgi:sensor histidine kinase regulating citrate/malate metabolism
MTDPASPCHSRLAIRAGHSTKGNGHVGLGLAIVKKLVTDLQGKISHSTGESGETSFIVDLPATPAQLS